MDDQEMSKGTAQGDTATEYTGDAAVARPGASAEAAGGNRSSTAGNASCGTSGTPSGGTAGGSVCNPSQASNTCGKENTADLMAMLRGCHIPSGMCRWLTYLRRPAMTLQYTLSKRHIPDLDAERQAAKVTAGKAESVTAPSSGSGAPAPTGSETGSAAPGMADAACVVPMKDTMQASGHCAIRYFDLAVGMMAIGMILCMCKCCKGLKHKLF